MNGQQVKLSKHKSLIIEKELSYVLIFVAHYGHLTH